MRRKIVFLSMFVLSLILAGVALAASSPNYDLPADALSGGGGEHSSSSYSLVDISGQSTTIGESTSSNYQLQAGSIPVLRVVSSGQDMASVQITVALQGSSRPDPDGWAIPVTVTIGSTSYGPITTNKSGDSAICQITDVMSGTYDIAIDGDTTLTNIKRGVTITEGTNSLDMGTLLEGDANGDGIINISDFGILAVAFVSTPSDSNWDARADFDRNGIVNISDFGLLAVNFMKTSPVEVP